METRELLTTSFPNLELGQFLTLTDLPWLLRSRPRDRNHDGVCVSHTHTRTRTHAPCAGRTQQKHWAGGVRTLSRGGRRHGFGRSFTL